MQIFTHITALRAELNTVRRHGHSLAFVPTLGNLHAGHAHLVEHAKQWGDKRLVSIFVNPLQFGANEDYALYPRTRDADARLLESLGTDYLFAPELTEMVPPTQTKGARVAVPELSAILCGAHRPKHFNGVATVVAKLFNIVQPDVALFGEKDYQQLQVVRSLVAALNFPVQIIGVKTVRAPDGLALSSRNHYLTAEERQTAPLLYQTLQWIREAWLAGRRDYLALEREAKNNLLDHGFKTDYVAIRDSATLLKPTQESSATAPCVALWPLALLLPASLQSTECRALAAAWLGKTRLIDNLALE